MVFRSFLLHAMQSSSDFTSIEQVHHRLRVLSQDQEIVTRLEQALKFWNHRSTPSVEDFQQDVRQVAEELIGLLFPQDEPGLKGLVEACVHHEVYDAIFGLLKNSFAAKDLQLYSLSRGFCKANGSPKQLGATFYNFVPSAAVVELSMLASQRTPMEKLHCLQCSYDYIFAEVKGALISVISKYSDKEIDLPFISNQEVIPILMAVIMKSKLFYALSELAYIRTFGADLLENNPHLREIFAAFEESIERILSRPISGEAGETLSNQMDVCETIKFIQVSSETTEKRTVFGEEKRRVARLITAATTEDLISHK